MTDPTEQSLAAQIQYIDGRRHQAADANDRAHFDAIHESLLAQQTMERVMLAQNAEPDHANDPMVINCTIQVCPSGSRFSYSDTTVDMIDIRDMAWHLAGIRRFGAGSRSSVAQHLVMGCGLLEAPLLKRCYFMHDGEEYVMGDCPSQLKKIIGPKFREIANRVREVIFRKFGLPAEWAYELPAEVKRVDGIMLEWERRDQMPTVDWIEKHTLSGYGPYTAWTPVTAEMNYLRKFRELWEGLPENI